MGYQLQQYKVILEKLGNLDNSYAEHRKAAKAEKSFFRSVGSVGENKSRSQTLDTLKTFKNQIALIGSAIQEDKHRNPSDQTLIKHSQLLHAASAFFLAQIYQSYKIALFEDKLVLPKEPKNEAATLSTVSNSGMARALCEILGIEKFGELSSGFSDYLRQFKTTLEEPAMEHIKKLIDMKEVDQVIEKITEHYQPKKQAEEAPAAVVRSL